MLACLQELVNYWEAGKYAIRPSNFQRRLETSMEEKAKAEGLLLIIKDSMSLNTNWRERSEWASDLILQHF